MKDSFIHFYSDDFNSTYAVIQKILITDGEYVKVGTIIALVETSKKVIEIEAEFDGFLFWLVQANSKIENGEKIAIVTKEKKLKDEIKNHLPVINLSIESEVVSFKVGKLSKELGISVSEIKDNNLKSENELYDYVSKKHGVRISELNKHQLSLSNSLQGNEFVSYVSIEVDKKLLNEKISKLSNKYKIDITLDTILLWSIRDSLLKYEKVASWIQDGKWFEDLDKNVGVYVTKKLDYGIPVEISGKNISIPNLAATLFEHLYAIESGSALKKLPCAIYLSNLSKTNAKVVVPVLKRLTSSTIVVTNVGSNYLMGMSFDHRIFEGNYALAFLNEITAVIGNI